MAVPLKPDDFVQFAEVVARWSGFEISTVQMTRAISSSRPVGRVSHYIYRRTGESCRWFGSDHIRGKRPHQLVTRKGVVYEGIVSVNRGNYLYDNSILGWEPLESISDQRPSDVTWTSEVSEDGNFEIASQQGNGRFHCWTVSLNMPQ